MIVSGKQSGRQDVVKSNDLRSANRNDLRTTNRNDLRTANRNNSSADILCKGVTFLALVFCLAACTTSVGGWRQSSKNEASTRADYAQCRNQAEETTLILRREERPGYGTESADRPGPFNPRGDNTMAISERSDATNLQDALVDSCMSRKGYSRSAD